ncbi:MAG: hypothetical protein BMS9Abin39_0680 [Ignavibacteria bacterium]|nr:MAG: hypothetical protein BMS9Abin39_0680 [Ignavibacteria bacterium]
MTCSEILEIVKKYKNEPIPKKTHIKRRHL